MPHTYKSAAQVFKQLRPAHYCYDVENMFRGIEGSQNPTNIDQGYLKLCAVGANSLKQYLSQVKTELTHSKLDWDYIEHKIDCLEHRLEQVHQYLLNPHSSKFTQKDIRSYANTITPSFRELQTD